MTRFSSLASAIAGAVAAVLVAGCGPSSNSSAESAPTTSAAGSVPPSAAPTSRGPSGPATSSSPAPANAQSPASALAPSASPGSCATYAATHTFAEVTAARENADGSLTITAHRATVVCGGLDDLHYREATATETGTVTSSGTVEMLTGAVKEQTVDHSDVSARLAKDSWGRIFMVTGQLTDITGLTEMYHP